MKNLLRTIETLAQDNPHCWTHTQTDSAQAEFFQSLAHKSQPWYDTAVISVLDTIQNHLFIHIVTPEGTTGYYGRPHATDIEKIQILHERFWGEKSSFSQE